MTEADVKSSRAREHVLWNREHVSEHVFGVERFHRWPLSAFLFSYSEHQGGEKQHSELVYFGSAYLVVTLTKKTPPSAHTSRKCIPLKRSCKSCNSIVWQKRQAVQKFKFKLCKLYDKLKMSILLYCAVYNQSNGTS